MNMKTKKRFTNMQIIALGYLCVIIAGALLLMLPVSSVDGKATNPVDAVFTSTSAACVTGLTTLPTYEHWSFFGRTVILLLIQIGGLGFMSMVTLLMVFSGKSISLRERSLFMNSFGESTIGGVVHSLRGVFVCAFAAEAIGTAVLSIRFCPSMGFWRGLYFALFHAVSAFCNAGFDLMGKFGEASLTAYVSDPTVNITIMLLVIVGGLGFIVWRDVVKNKFKFKNYHLHTKIVLTVSAVLIFAGAALFLAFEWTNSASDLDVKGKIFSSLFDSVTARTAGFFTVDFAKLGDASVILFIILMVIGGAPGSTAGGIKVTTFTALLLGAVSSARKSPSTEIFKRRLNADISRQASAIFTIYCVMIACASMAICAIEPFSTKEVLFETVSALSNVGVTMGITSALHSASKIIIIFLMYMGRVGILSLVLAFAEKRENIPAVRPCEDILL